MAAFDETAFLDMLYEAPANSDLWVPVLERLKDVMGGASCWLSSLSVVNGSGGGLGNHIDPETFDLFFNYYSSINPLNIVSDPDAYFRDWRPLILTDEDWMPKEDFIRTEYYNDFMLRQKVDSTAMIRLAKHGRNVSVINVGRALGRGRFERYEIEAAERLHGHLIRAYKLSERLASIQVFDGGATAVFEDSPHALFVLDKNGRVSRLNRAAEQLIKAQMGVSISGGRLRAVGGEAANRLATLISAATDGSLKAREGGFMALAVPDRTAPLSVTVTPVGEGVANFFNAERCTLVTVTDLAVAAPPPQQRLRDLFGLTAAEARLTLALLDGSSRREAAASLGISTNTASVQLGQIFEKTGVNRQSALVGLVTRATGAVGS